MVSIKSLQPHTRGRDIILPIVGQITFDENNEFQMSSLEDAKILTSFDGIQLEICEIKEKKEKSDENNANKEKKEGDVGKVETAEEKYIRSRTLNELRTLSKDFPKAETKILRSKNDFISYLVSKL